MAQRRMFSLKIVDTDAFLDMPQSSQLLYFHLSMRADDEGFVGNPKKIMKISGGNDDDMKVLLAKRFILTFESGVVVIKHWFIHNYIQKDRFDETSYLDEKKLLVIKENKAYTEADKTKCIQNVSKMETQVRLGKVSIGKDRLDKEELGLATPTTRKEITFNGSDYDKVIASYEQLKGIKFQGPEYLPIQQAIKSMFMSGRSAKDIIACMVWFKEKAESGEKEYVWTENWTIQTIKMKIAEFLAGKFSKAATAWENIPEAAKQWIKN